MPASSTAGLTNTTYPAPANAVVIAAGSSIQAAVDSHPAGTAFLLSAGTYSGQTISLASGDSFYGVPGQTILNGNGAQQAFRGQGVSNVTLSGLTITNYAPAPNGVGTLGTDGSAIDWTVQGCTFTGIISGVPIMLGEGMVVRNCTINGNQNGGIGSWNVNGAIVENNDIFGNNQSNQSPFTATSGNAGIKISGSTGVQIINNTIHDNQSAPGIWTDLGCSGSVISGNSITGNGGPGILDELDYGATISNNVIENNNNPALPGFLGGGIYVQNSANATISSNTLSGNVGGVYVYQSDRGSGTQGAYVVNNDKVSDNTIQMQAGVNGFTSGISNANVAFTGNNYYLSGSAQLLAAGSNVSVAQWQGGGEDSASTGATFSTAAAIPAPAVPAASATPTLTSPGPVAAGPAPDTLDLHISEDAWNGNAQFTVSINGQTVGGTYTATASHAAGATQDFSLAGNWGQGVKSVAVSFINDAYGGTASTDRNLYVDQVSYDGQAATGAPAALYSNGTKTFATPQGATALGISLAEDAWQGNAQYSIAVDGHTLVGDGSATALNSQNQSQTVDLQSVLTAGPHDVAVSFLNDAYGGTPATDRNLYVKGISVDGQTVAGANATLWSTGTEHFQITVPAG